MKFLLILGIIIFSLAFLLNSVFIRNKKVIKENFISDDEFKKMFEEHIKNCGYEKYKVSSTEYDKRFNIFKNNLKNTDIGNNGKFKGKFKPTFKPTFKTGITQFSSWTPEEYQSLFFNEDECNKENFVQIEENSFLYRKIVKVQLGKFTESYNLATTDNQYKKICLGEIRNQNQCGSCWAFQVISILENIIYINEFTTKGQNYSINTPLSVQQIIDCTSSKTGCAPGLPNKACSGGWFQTVIDTYLNKQTYICTESIYPYTLNTERDASTYTYPGCTYADANCNLVSSRGTLFKKPSCYLIPQLTAYQVSLNEVDVKKAIFCYGALAIRIKCAVEPLFSRYIGGIYNGPSIPDSPQSTKIIHNIHQVVVCGWGSNKDGDYWIFRNSWGKDRWGKDQKGYFLLPRNYKDPLLSIDNQKYGYGAIFKYTYLAKIADPCTLQQKSSYTITCKSEPYNTINNTSNAIIEIFGKIPPHINNPKIKIANISNKQILDQYSDKEGNLLDKDKNIVVDNENNYYSDKNHTIVSKLENEAVDTYFYYKFVIGQNSTIFGYDTNEQEVWTLNVVSGTTNSIFRLKWFQHIIKNYDSLSKNLEIIIDFYADPDDISNIQICYIIKGRTEYTIAVDLGNLNTEINNIVIKFPSIPQTEKILCFYLCDRTDKDKAISNKWYL